MARLLIVEDEPLIAMMLEDFAETLGHEIVVSADSVDTGLEAVGSGGFDVAILDVRLRGGQSCWPVADAIAATGTPFVLATGGEQDIVPDRHRGCPFLEKPFTLESVERSLERVLADT